MTRSAAGSSLLSICDSDAVSTCRDSEKCLKQKCLRHPLLSESQSKEGQTQTVLQRRVTPMPKPEDPRKGFLAEMT